MIVFGGSSLDVLYGDFLAGVAKKQDGPVSPALLEALPGRFICFGESDVNPRPIRAGRIEGPWRG